MSRILSIFIVLWSCFSLGAWSQGEPTPDRLYQQGLTYQDLDQIGLARYYLEQSRWLAPWSSDVQQRIEALPFNLNDSVTPPLFSPCIPMSVLAGILVLGNLILIVGAIWDKPTLRRYGLLILAGSLAYLTWLGWLVYAEYGIILVDTPLRLHPKSGSTKEHVLRAGTLVRHHDAPQELFQLIESAHGTGYIYPQEVGYLNPFHGTWLPNDQEIMTKEDTNPNP